jgi:hypothetical protein
MIISFWLFKSLAPNVFYGTINLYTGQSESEVLKFNNEVGITIIRKTSLDSVL